MHGMTSCWFCHEPVDEPAEVLPAPLVTQSSGASVASVAAPPVQETRATRASVPVFPSRRHLSPGGAMFLWLILVVFLTLLMLAVEVWMPRYPSISPASLDLGTQVYIEHGFSIAYPAGWTVKSTKKRVTFSAPEPIGPPTRGLRVMPSGVDFVKVDNRARELNRERVAGYRTLDRAGRTIAGRDAFLFVFAGDGLRFEQWWIDRGRWTVRLEFWSRLADDGAAELNERIARTLRLL